MLDFGVNVGFVEELYARWLENPESVDPSWRAYFAGTPAASPSRNGHGNGHDHPLDSTPAILRCLDLDEEAALPENLALGHRTYAEFKKHAVAPAG